MSKCLAARANNFQHVWIFHSRVTERVERKYCQWCGDCRVFNTKGEIVMDEDMQGAEIDYDEVSHHTMTSILVRIDGTDHWIHKTAVNGEIPDEFSGPGTMYIEEDYATKRGLV